MALMEPTEAPSPLPNPSVPKVYPAPTDVRNSPQYEDADDDGVRMRRERAQPPVPLVDTKALPLPPLDGDLKRGKHDGLLGYLAGTDRQVIFFLWCTIQSIIKKKGRTSVRARHEYKLSSTAPATPKLSPAA